MDPNALNLDSDPGFWPDLDSDPVPDPDPGPDPGFMYKLKIKNNLKRKTIFFTKVHFLGTKYHLTKILVSSATELLIYIFSLVSFLFTYK